MNKAFGCLAKTVAALLAAAFVVVAEAIAFDPKLSAAALLTIAWLTPSVLVYLLMDCTRRFRLCVKTLVFAVTLAPLCACLMYGMIVSREGATFAAVFGGWYLSGAAAAYIALRWLS